jgi:hypothetical protein
MIVTWLYTLHKAAFNISFDQNWTVYILILHHVLFEFLHSIAFEYEWNIFLCKVNCLYQRHEHLFDWAVLKAAYHLRNISTLSSSI